MTDMDSGRGLDLEQVMTDSLARWEHAPPLQLEIPRADAWWLLMRLLPTVRGGGPDAVVADTIARQLQAVADTPELHTVVQAARLAGTRPRVSSNPPTARQEPPNRP